MEDAPLTGGDDPDVEAALFADPTSFSFFQAVRLLERRRGRRTTVGGFGSPSEEAVRFTPNPSLSFPASEIQTLEASGSAAPVMSVNFFGLIGPQGVLPYWYTLLVGDRLRSRDPALQSFLDIFQHRIIALFYRAWAKSRAFVGVERGETDRTSLLLRSIVGLGRQHRSEAAELRDDFLLYYCGFLGAHRRSAIGLEQLVSDFFGVPARVEQFVGGWYGLPADSLCRVGESLDGSSQLGLGAIAGDEIWDPQIRIRLSLGPLTRTEYDGFLPTGAAYGEIRELVQLYAGDEVDVELQLVLRHDEVPPCVLGAEEKATQLGWSTWIRTQAFARDAADATLTL